MRSSDTRRDGYAMGRKMQEQAVINGLLLRIADLVVARALQQRDANEAGLRKTNAEIGRLQWRLARIVQAERSHQRAA
jgi:hypothetical protein